MLLPEFVLFFFCVCVLLFNCGVRCYYVGNQSCIEWFFNPLRNLLFNLKIHLLLTGFFFFSPLLHKKKIHITSQALKYLYQFNVIIKHTRNIFLCFFFPFLSLNCSLFALSGIRKIIMKYFSYVFQLCLK